MVTIKFWLVTFASITATLAGVKGYPVLVGVRVYVPGQRPVNVYVPFEAVVTVLFAVSPPPLKVIVTPERFAPPEVFTTPEIE